MSNEHDKVLKALQALSKEELIDSLYAIAVHLYNTDDGWNRDKEWDSETIEDVAREVPDLVRIAIGPTDDPE